MKLCTFEGCDTMHHARGMCHYHYNLWAYRQKHTLVDEWKRKPLKSDNLELTGLSPSEETNLIATVRNLYLGGWRGRRQMKSLEKA